MKTVSLYAPPDVNEASIDGKTYKVSGGKIEVPESAVAELTRPVHGFSLDDPALRYTGPLRRIGERDHGKPLALTADEISRRAAAVDEAGRKADPNPPFKK